MNRRDFLKASAGCVAASTLGGVFTRALAQGADGSKPNIVLILADDLGWGETGVQGGRGIPTPHIDSIAAGGVRFTDGYVSCPVCSPTRAGLLTGRYQQRFGHEFNPGPVQTASVQFGLPLTETTLADRLKSLGYATGLVGKWHLGNRPEFHPVKRGFEEFFGFLGGAHSYLDARADPANRILRQTEAVDEDEYLTDAFGREAAAFIERNKDRPFFLYLSFNAVHAPLQAPPRYLDRFKDVADTKRRTFSAMLSAMDDNIGRVLAKLKEHNLTDNTLVVFLSDNGGPTPQTTSANGPLSGYKGQVLEGGIRVPFMMQWPAKLPKGIVYKEPVIALDICATALAAAGGPVPQSAKLDGVDLVPFITGVKAGAAHERLFWRFGPQGALRQGDWKLVKRAGTGAELYNLKSDIGEKTDLAEKEPEKLKELQAAWDAWDSELAKPLWTRGARRPARAARRRRVVPSQK